MSEWITTGRMMEVLEEDERAETEKGDEMFWEDGTLVVVTKLGHRYTHIKKGLMNILWRKTPDYVSFIEAMRALEHGETITLHKHNAICEFNSADNIKVIDRFGPCATFSDFVYANWSIKD